MSESNETPRIIKAGLAVDDRGQLTFANDFSFSDVKRFYMVQNHVTGFVRAWHGHKKEAKYVLPVSGSAIVAAVKVDDWENPDKSAEIHRYVLSATAPTILYIPAGYANGFKTLSADARLMFFSTSTIEESRGDDIRFEARYWDAWEVVER
ncbi:MAG: dTDP-4-dehydrorhamnose 3,5-epimerase family protein [Fimbriimonas sp.]|nr:dTDP-4-dehydrorhamnose 3,5-epimerase family protein [Fimbriimonas sp.]